MVVLIDPDNSSDLKIEKFADMYGLTKAEANVCDLVLKGHTTPAIAEIRSTSAITAKNQVAAIFAKTMTSRRGDLIRLVIRTLPPII